MTLRRELARSGCLTSPHVFDGGFRCPIRHMGGHSDEIFHGRFTPDWHSWPPSSSWLLYRSSEPRREASAEHRFLMFRSTSAVDPAQGRRPESACAMDIAHERRECDLETIAGDVLVAIGK
jgi:hypothetical protein